MDNTPLSNDSQDEGGYTPLHLAAEEGRTTCMEHPISTPGNNVNIKSVGGYTPLHLAAREGHTTCMEHLLSTRGIDVNIKYGPIPLHLAAMGGHTTCVEHLLSTPGIDVNIKSVFGYTPLHLAARGGHTTCVEHLLSTRGIDVNIKVDTIYMYMDGDDLGYTPLHLAARGGHTTCVELLLSTPGIDVNIKRKYSSHTPLHLAAREGHISCVERLLSTPGIDVNIKDRYGYTPLHRAARGDHTTCVEHLLSTPGIDVNIKDEYGDTPLHLAARKGHTAYVERLLSTPGIDVNINDKDGYTPLHLAAMGGHTTCAERLLSTPGIDVNIKDNYRNTPLHLATREGHTTCVEHLLSTPGIDVNIKGQYGDTPLHLAARGGHTTCVKHLLSTPGIDVNIKNEDGYTPLHLAALGGHTTCVERLLSTPGIDVNIKGQGGYTPLHYAAKGGHTTCVEHLLSTPGIDLNIKDKDGYTPLHLAAAGGHTSCVEHLLFTPCIDVNIMDMGGNTPLHLAAERGHTTCMEHFLSTPGIDVNIKTEDGDTPLHSAAEDGNVDCVKQLLSTPGIDVNIRNCNHFTPLMMATKYDVITLLQKYSTCYENYPVHTFNKVILCGDAGAGKSSLAKAIIESSTSARRTGHAKQMPNLDEVAKPLTAGIVSYQVQNLNSNMMLYDLAGHQSYYSSHSSLLEAISLTSPSTFLMLVDVSVGTIEQITAQMYNWSAMISNVCHKCPQPSSVIVVGTHADKVEMDYVMALGGKMEKLAKGIFKRHTFEQFIALNVTERGDGLKSFLSFLDGVNDNVRQRSPAISLSNHLMYAFLNDKVPSYEEALPMSHLLSLLDKEVPRVLPTEKSEIMALLTTLAEKGFIVFLHTDSDDSWIVLDQGTLLEKVNGALFAPSFFEEHLPIASNTGIIPLEVLKDHFPNHNTAMIVQFLIQLELCQHISLEHINTNMAPKNPSSDLLFFPPLISEDRPHFESDDISTTEGCFGWLLSTNNIHQFFPNRFLHTLVLKVAYGLCLPDTNRTIDTDIKNKNRQCKVWRCGISWNSVYGVSTVIELMEQSRDLFLVTSFPDSSVLNELIPVLQTIRNTLSQFCPSIAATEYIVDPSKASSVFTQGCSVTSLTRVQLSHLRDALKIGRSKVVDIKNKKVDLKKWISVEPFLECLVSIVVNDTGNNDKSSMSHVLDEEAAQVNISSSTSIGMKRISIESSTDIQPSLDTPHEGETAQGSIFSQQQPSSISPLHKSLEQDITTTQESPTLEQLLHFTGKTRTFNVAAQVGTAYSKMGVFLLKDQTGAVVQALEKEHMRDAERISMAIFSRWLQRKGAQPVAWSTLIDVLIKIDLCALADDIEGGLM